MFKQLNEEKGITVILVTHDPEVAKYARRVIHIRDGVIENGVPGAGPSARVSGSAGGQKRDTSQGGRTGDGGLR
jgi:ABC-type lipoprotein export system ATPase subunit